MQYEEKALQIDLLRQTLFTLNDHFEELSTEYDRLHPAYRYMNDLVRVLRKYPSLQDEWQNVLEAAGFSEPEWKDDYEAR